MEKLINLLEEFIKLSEKNQEKNIFIQKIKSEDYFKYLPWEIEEVKAEFRENNSVYLEDELADVLWVYLNLLNKLELDKMITSREKVIKRWLKKFWERIANLDQTSLDERKKYWSEIKKKQKQELTEEHNNKYNK